MPFMDTVTLFFQGIMLIGLANAGNDKWKNAEIISEGTTMIAASRLV